MKYKIENIGAAFTNKDMDTLATRLSTQSELGWELHSVFSVQQKGCMGANEGTTYLAIFREKE